MHILHTYLWQNTVRADSRVSIWPGGGLPLLSLGPIMQVSWQHGAQWFLYTLTRWETVCRSITWAMALFGLSDLVLLISLRHVGEKLLLPLLPFKSRFQWWPLSLWMSHLQDIYLTFFFLYPTRHGFKSWFIPMTSKRHVYHILTWAQL